MRVRRRQALPGAHRDGFSLIELMIACALLAVVFGTFALVANTGDRLYRGEGVASHLESRVAIATEQVMDELRTAGIDTIAPDPLQGIGASSVQYRQAVGFAGGQAIWTTPRRIAFEYETGEIDDGIDNNGNGLVDEGQLVVIEDVGGPNELRRVLSHWVSELLEGEIENGVDDNGNGLIDEPGFCLERVGGSVIVRLTLQRRVDSRLSTRTAQSSTMPRNRLVQSP